jgi:hypothetical protein
MFRFDVLAATSALLLSISLVGGGSSPEKVRKETTVQQTPGGPAPSTRTTTNGREVQSMRTEWESEIVTAEGSAPVVQKYDDGPRNRARGRRGAVLDAQPDLARQVSQIQITERTMHDLETSDFVQSRLHAILQDVSVVSETFNESTEQYRVTVEMPEVEVVSVIEEYAQRRP